MIHFNPLTNQNTTEAQNPLLLTRSRETKVQPDYYLEVSNHTRTPDADYIFRTASSGEADKKHELVIQIETQLSEDRYMMLEGESVAQLAYTNPPQVTQNHQVFCFNPATVSTISNTVLKLGYYKKLGEPEKALIMDQMAEAIMTEMEYRVERANEHLPGHLIGNVVGTFKSFVETALPETLKSYFVWHIENPIEANSLLERFTSMLRLYEQEPIMIKPKSSEAMAEQVRYINPKTLALMLERTETRFYEVLPLLQSCQDFMRPEMQMEEHRATSTTKPEFVFFDMGTSLSELDSFITNYLLPLPSEYWPRFLDPIGAEIASCFTVASPLRSRENSIQHLQEIKVQFESLPGIVQYYVEVYLSDDMSAAIRSGHY
jgi:hypothetical protein